MSSSARLGNNLIMDPRDFQVPTSRARETVSRIDTRGKVKVEDKPGV